MCGISVIISRTPLTSDAIQAMGLAQNNRGPDGYTYKRLNIKGFDVWLGHHLLALQSAPENSLQPVVSDDGTKALLYNGEIFHLPDLNDGNPEPLTDTEWLFRVFSLRDAEQKMQLLDQTMGQQAHQYAIVWVDAALGVLEVYTDPWGVIPLYVYQDNELLIVASEPETIVKSGLIKAKIDQESITHLLNYKYPLPNRTQYRNINRVSIGRYLISETGIRYEPQKREKVSKNKTTRTDLSSLLTLAVVQRLQSTRQAAIMYSGGLDSTLMAWAAVESGFKPTLLHFHNDKTTSEPLRAFADKAGLDLKTCGLPDTATLRQWLCEAPMPIADSAWVSTRTLAAQGYPVLLSGAGADELFGGYRRHRAFHYYSLGLRVIPWFLHKPYHALLSFFQTLLPERSILKCKSLYGTPGEVWDDFVRIPMTEHPTNTLLCKVNNLQEAIQHDRDHYLKYDVLAMTDMAAMAEGVEVRLPYLSEFMSDYAEQLHNGGESKYMSKKPLWQLAKKWELIPYITANKTGFGLNPDVYLRSSNGQVLLKTTNFQVLKDVVDVSVAQKMVDALAHTSKPYGQAVWALMCVALWLENRL